ncbi:MULTISPECIES: HNH endonuclease signature motif containing protein [Gordonia]|uniref:HNH endonuclease signature motif containing protein n=1 Tax=Gordonia oleivorans TaxID=3156618 RepID=UPI0032B5F070
MADTMIQTKQVPELSMTPDDAAMIDHLPGEAATVLARSLQRQERQVIARKVLSAARIGQSVFLDMLTSGHEINCHTDDGADKAATSKISTGLGVSVPKAKAWMALSSVLSTLPTVTAAFLDGDHSLERIRIIADEIVVLSDDDVRAFAETRALEIAERNQADPTLRDQVAEMVIALDPDGAADRREDAAERDQNVRVRRDTNGHCNISVYAPGEMGAHLAARIAKMINVRICTRDPRRRGQQRVAAFAEIQGLPGAHLSCECGLDDCPRAVPLPEEPADLDPAGDLPHDVDADRAAQLDFSESDTIDNADAGAEGEDESADSDDDTDAQLLLDLAIDPVGQREARLAGFGVIDDSHAAHLIRLGLVEVLEFPGLEIPRTAGIVTSLDRVPAAWRRPDIPFPATPIDPSGHGGYLTPPKGALTYRIPAWLREKIIELDGTCRYPHCGRPASECQIDHVVKFVHRDPKTGGWTVEFNLMPLCIACHQRKHMGLLIPTMLTDRAVVWRDPVTGETITTYPR